MRIVLEFHRAVAVSALIAATLALVAVASGPSAPQTNAAVSTANQYIVDADNGVAGIQSTASIPVGSDITVAWVIANIADAWSAEQANIQFDPGVVSITGDPTDTNLGSAFLCGGTKDPDSVYWGCGRISGTTSAAGVTRTMVVHCLAAGTSALHLQSNAEIGVATGTNFALAAGVGEPTTLTDASITCVGAQTSTPTVTPTATITLTPTRTPTPTRTSTASPTATNTPCGGPIGCPDTDGDGMPDEYEGAHPCLDPNVSDGAADADRDVLVNVDEYVLGADPCVFDTDGDMCADGDEVHRVGLAGNPLNPWDFYSVPIPALRLNPAGFRDRGIGVTTDVLALLAYVGMNSSSPDYIADIDSNNVADGLQYDRSAIQLYGASWPDAPDAGIGVTTDVVAMLRQVGFQCRCLDSDADGLCDDIDLDDDNDGLLDAYELAHSCLSPLIMDSGGDPDGDGAVSLTESVQGTDPCVPDTDNDGMHDGFEIVHACLDPLVNDAAGDPDGDGAPSLTEYGGGTDACDPDTDQDGLPDGYEYGHSCEDPLVADGASDPDSDSLGNLEEYFRATEPCDPDSDNDALIDGFEVTITTDPLDQDTDYDLCGDAVELGLSRILGGQRDPTDPYDFYSVPVPALRLNPAGVRDNGVGVTSDVVALLAYVGLTSSSPDYIADNDGNGVMDGLQYDRRASLYVGEPWRSGPPDGGIGITTDVIVMLNQTGHICTLLP